MFQTKDVEKIKTHILAQ